MNRPASIVSMVVVGAVLLAVGFGAGIYYNMPQLQKAEALIKNLSSKTIISSVAYGQVVKVEGKDITLSYSGDTIKISMEANSPVYSFSNDSTGKQIQKKVDLKEVKTGDSLNITMKLLPDGQIQGQSVLILLSSPK